MGMPQTLLSLDVGTTHCKAGLFQPDGRLIASASRLMKTTPGEDGQVYYDPDEMWKTVLVVMGEVLQSAGGEVASIGIASMAETGLLVDQHSGKPRSVMIPWFNTRSAAPVSKQMADNQEMLRTRFLLSGIWPSYKYSVARLLWLSEQDPSSLAGTVWLSAADYVAYRLTGQMATDYSLAGRTYAFQIEAKAWDTTFLAQLGLSEVGFPPAYPGGSPMGEVAASVQEETGLAPGIPVVIAGHDHPCAAFGMHAVLEDRLEAPPPGQVFNSMGTAEAMLGTLPFPVEDDPVLGERQYHSRLSYGCHVIPDRYYWMGGLSTSGGSVEWLREILNEEKLSYEQVISLAEAVQERRPGSILYFPYLAGSGSPHTDPLIRGSFVGLDRNTSRGDLLNAILEGTACEMEYVRRSAEASLGVQVTQLVASGGGTHNPSWLQIKADISGIPILVPAVSEATLLGAALLAGIGAGIFHWGKPGSLHRPYLETYTPDPSRHAGYQDLYEGFLELQEPFRNYFRRRARNLSTL